MVSQPTSRTTQVDEDPLDDWDPDRIRFIDVDEGRLLVDPLARDYLGISGEEFVQRYRTRELTEEDHPEVIRVAMVLPAAALLPNGEEPQP